MARLPRYCIPGQPQHVIQRGNNRSPIFFCKEDYEFFLECLRDASSLHDCAVHAYVLMTNHVHLLVTPARVDGVSKLMQSVGRRYVQYVNFTYRRTGTLWEGRYKAIPLDGDDYFVTCHCYIESNPVRAGMVDGPGAYRWSSYRHNADGAPDPLIQRHRLFAALGTDDQERRAAYRKLFRAGLSDNTLLELRDATNKGWVLGSAKFKRKIESVASRRVEPLQRGGKRRGAGRPRTKDE
jgi:putative transposase